MPVPTDQPVAFQGMIRMLAPELDDEVFTRLDAQQSIEVIMDLAESHDVVPGGVHSVIAKGEIEYANLDSTQVIGKIPYESNRLDIEIDSIEATSRRQAFHKVVTRAQIDSTCNSSRNATLQTAFKNCAKYATAASNAAFNGSASK